MSGKDFLTILLVAYGFKNIEISTYRGYGNAMIQMEEENVNFLPHKATVEELIEHFKKE